jgi:uncharacterized protein YicC (UPF0701 family)
MDPTTIGLVVLALIQILQLVVTLRKAVGAPEKREITALPATYMTEERCREMHTQAQRFEQTRFEQLQTSIENLSEALDRRNSEGESRAAKIHSRIDGVATQVSELRGQVNNHIEHGGHNA